MEQEQNYKKGLDINSIIIIIIIICILAVLGVKVYIKANKKPEKTNENEVEIKQLANADTMTKLIKEYFYEKDYAKKDKLESWNINEITYMGDLNNLKYYKVEGTFSCIDLTTECLYIPQVGEKVENAYEYIFYIAVEDKDNNVTIKNVEEILPEELASNKESVMEQDTKNDEKITNMLKEYYKSKNLMTESNIKSLNFTNVEYVKTTNNGIIYEVSGNYACKDDTTSCFYLTQNNEPINSSYYFKLYILIDNDQIKSVDMLLAEEPLDSIFTSTGTKDKIINLVQEYCYNNSFANKTNIDKWVIDNVTLVGYYDNKITEKIYKLEGSYKCLDGESDCVYLEQIGNKNSDSTYSYQIYAYVNVENNTLNLKSLSGAITNNDIILINKIVR